MRFPLMGHAAAQQKTIMSACAYLQQSQGNQQSKPMFWAADASSTVQLSQRQGTMPRPPSMLFEMEVSDTFTEGGMS